jgi:D-glucosaminate-6-phosphate ammonia-lyase
MVDTSERAMAHSEEPTSVYDVLGVRTIINARGATTAVGGSLMRREVTEAMERASQRFVVLEELNARVGEKIAAATGAEAGYVTAGSAAGMALAAAACIAGTDPTAVRGLPDTNGLPNQIVVHRTHRLRYDQMFRAAGAELIEIGFPQGTEPWELDKAINERTAAIAFHDSPAVGPTALDFETVVQIAHEHDVPVIVDAASTLPPVDHLRRWIRWGADLVIYSGGKGIRGPQDSGLLAGRADLIAAAAANGPPNVGIGRGMKVSKEAMVGLSVALDLFLAHDHDHDFKVHREQAEFLRQEFASRPDTDGEVIGDPEQFPAPVLVLRPLLGAWSPIKTRTELIAGEPSIHANVEMGGLVIHTHCLVPGEESQIADRLRLILDGA